MLPQLFPPVFHRGGGGQKRGPAFSTFLLMEIENSYMPLQYTKAGKEMALL